MKVIIDLDTGECDPDELDFEDLDDLIQEAFDNHNWSARLIKIITRIEE